MQSFWSSCFSKPGSIATDSNYRNCCISTIREVLSNADIADVIIDIIINNIFADYTLYGLCHTVYRNNHGMFVNHEYKYKVIDHGLNTNNLLFTNKHIYLYQNSNLYVTTSSSLYDDYVELQHIGKNDDCSDFIVCTGQTSSDEEVDTYLFDNKTGQFYSYNHAKNKLIKMQYKCFRSPPFPIKQIVKNLNNHKLAYYWCLMTNGILFKIVFDHNFFITAHNIRRGYIRQNNYITEYGPFEYHQNVQCRKHTVDLEVFRLIPTKIPKMKEMACGGEHILFIDSENHLWVYGNNKFGQCGIKKTTDIIVQPIKNQIFKDIAIKNIFCGKNRSIVIDNKGICYIFGEGINVEIKKPYKLFQSFDGFNKVKIIMAGCGDEHFIFIDDNENIYGLGCNKKKQISSDNNIQFYDYPKLILREYIGITDKKMEKICKVIVNGNFNYFVTTRNAK